MGDLNISFLIIRLHDTQFSIDIYYIDMSVLPKK